MSKPMKTTDGIHHRERAIEILGACLPTIFASNVMKSMATDIVDHIINAILAEMRPQIHAAATAYQVGIGSNRGEHL